MFSTETLIFPVVIFLSFKLILMFFNRQIQYQFEKYDKMT